MFIRSVAILYTEGVSRSSDNFMKELLIISVIAAML